MFGQGNTLVELISLKSVIPVSEPVSPSANQRQITQLPLVSPQAGQNRSAATALRVFVGVDKCQICHAVPRHGISFCKSTAIINLPFADPTTFVVSCILLGYRNTIDKHCSCQNRSLFALSAYLDYYRTTLAAK